MRPCSGLALGVETIIAAVALAVPLWKLALTMGRGEGEMRQLLVGITRMVEDHEERLRDLEAAERR